MTTLHKAAQQALDWLYDNDVVHPTKVSEDLRAALAQQQAGAWQDGVLEGHLRERERWLAQQAEPVQEPDLSLCPQCNGPADNGHDRSIPPNPYLCTKCMAEMPQPSYNVTVVDDAHPNGIPLAQWQNKPVQEPVAWRHKGAGRFTVNPLVSKFSEWEPLYTAPPQRKPLSLTDLQEALVLTNLIDRDAIDDSEEYDEGSTLAQIDELHRIIKERV